MPSISAPAAPGVRVVVVEVRRVGVAAVNSLALLRQVDAHVDRVPAAVVLAAPAHDIVLDENHVARRPVLVDASVPDRDISQVGRGVCRSGQRRCSEERTSHEREAHSHCLQLLPHDLPI